MGKLREGLDNTGLRIGNTVVAPLRVTGEAANAVVNIPRQGISGVKNIAEVTGQTVNALTDNFLNFGKVKGKWYQKLFKVPLNLVSACTRRPAMIVGAGALGIVNQGVLQPAKKLLATPGKLGKGVRNSLKRMFSKDKNFDFEKYDTHEIKHDTRISKIKDNAIGFAGVKPATGNHPEKVTEKKIESPKQEVKTETTDRWKAGPRGGDKENKKPEIKKIETPKSTENKKEVDTKHPPKGTKEWMKKMEKEKNDKEVDDYLAERGYSGGDKFGTPHKEEPKIPEPKKESEPKKEPEKKSVDTPVKSINDIEKKHKEETKEKEKIEKEKKFPEWKTLDESFKKEYRKEYKKTLKNNLTEEGIIARGKEAKMGNTSEEIIKNLNKEEPTFAGYMQEILNKPKHKMAA